MKNLIYKEIKIALHPTAPLFLLLSALLLIPNYPYEVIFFYTCLAVFFHCLSGRENHDIEYSLLLPIQKKSIVQARFLFVILLQMIQVLVAIPFVLLRNSLISEGNQAGMDANVALFGNVFFLMGIFNLIFFVLYYRKPDKVGKAFAISSIVFFTVMVILEVFVFAVPFFRDQLNTRDPMYLPQKLIMLVVGFVLYIIFTRIAYRKSISTFEKLDF
ncbi:MAG: ABC-2 transporter permease [Clostridiales bacterium]|jgi:hypothetical protein|nr:ABC-2 transporter permease [Clostridiales bacterium]MCI2160919.1 ABC-2 transporter permease [Oscillospiraceae bacterium]MCI1961568.1 ABC-2 transporter permease [Clostridiales bacterium]MCI2022023.1 ABC-2 transporter permease [Clostridiales bacterium]MCI2025962.1 ABC-2 transporter permease [Clostridiales bacterium]